TPAWSKFSRPTTVSPSPPGASRSTISSSTIRPTIVTAVPCRCWDFGCTRSSERSAGSGGWAPEAPQAKQPAVHDRLAGGEAEERGEAEEEAGPRAHAGRTQPQPR